MELAGGLLFYTVNIALVLQFVQFGEVLMADRYLYIACIGIIYPAIAYLFRWLEGKNMRMAAMVASLCVCAFFSSATYARNNIWLNELNFWNAIVETFPGSSIAQGSVGGVYLNMGRYDEAMQHIDEALKTDENNYKAWYNKGVVHLRKGQVNEALMALNKCISLNEYPKALFTRALVYQQMQQPLAALADVEKVLAQEPENARAHFIKGNCLELQNSLQGALNSYTQAIQNSEDEPLFYLRRGVVNAKMNQNAAALSDLDAVLQTKPNAEGYYWRGLVKHSINQSPCEDLQRSLQMGYKEAAEAIAQFCSH